MVLLHYQKRTLEGGHSLAGKNPTPYRDIIA